MADVAEIEVLLRSLIRGEHSSLTLSFNDECGPNYSTVAADEAEGQTHGDWVSEEERQRGIERNSKWILQWYPDTPIGFHALAASSLPALFDAVRDYLANQSESV